MQHKVPYTVEANGAVYFRIKINVYNFYIIILEMIIQLRNHWEERRADGESNTAYDGGAEENDDDTGLVAQ